MDFNRGQPGKGSPDRSAALCPGQSRSPSWRGGRSTARRRRRSRILRCPSERSASPRFVTDCLVLAGLVDREPCRECRTCRRREFPRHHQIKPKQKEETQSMQWGKSQLRGPFRYKINPEICKIFTLFSERIIRIKSLNFVKIMIN